MGYEAVGSMEFGQCPGVGCYIGNMEYGQMPYIGFYENMPELKAFVGIEMLKVIIPKFKYWISDYPKLDPQAEGLVIPEAYGDIHNITPICVDTDAGRWKLGRREIKAIDAVRDAGVTLTPGIDYIANAGDLAVAEFTILQTPYLSAGTYYFSIEGDWGTADPTKYIRVCRNAGYPDGQSYDIDGASNWNPSGVDLMFWMFGKENLEDPETLMVEWGKEGAEWHVGTGWQGYDNGRILGDAPPRTRIGQSFLVAAPGFYVSKIQIWWAKYGGVTGNLTLRIFSAIGPETQVGCASYPISVDDPNQCANFPQRGAPSELSVDIRGYMLKELPTLYPGDVTLMENVADRVMDKYVNVLGGDIADLNVAEFGLLKIARPQPEAEYLNEEMQFGENIQIEEAGILFKFLPNLINQFTTKYYSSIVPAGTPHLRDEDFVPKTFKMVRDWQAIFQRVQVKYYQNPTTQEWLVVEETSDIAQYIYRNQETLQIETFLKDKADAIQLAKDYLGTDLGSSRKVNLQYPQIRAEYENLEAINWDKIPTEKNKITRARAMSLTGNLSSTLFRLIEIEKIISNGNCRIVAILDSLTY